MTLTAIILTYNEQKHIQACIQSLSFVDRVVVFDSFSTDATVQLATEHHISMSTQMTAQMKQGNHARDS